MASTTAPCRGEAGSAAQACRCRILNQGSHGLFRVRRKCRYVHQACYVRIIARFGDDGPSIGVTDNRVTDFSISYSGKSAPGKIANRSLASVINLSEFPSATATLQPSVPSFAAYPQLQRLRLLVDLVLIHTIPGPVQNPGELSIRRQSAILAEISKSGPSH